MREYYLEFEEPIAALEDKIAQVETAADLDIENKRSELAKLRRKLKKTQTEIYSKLSPWQRIQIARHPNRPYTLDYLSYIFNDFVEFHGDRRFADDNAILAGFAKLEGQPVAIIGHQKGRNTKENIFRNFGMANPEGYRKAIRIMHLAEKFLLPVITFIDTPGAYPGIGPEERGQAEAIAYNLFEMARLKVPIIVVVTGEGGSGGALAIGVGDRILMLENAVYSVISAEGCAAILWKDRAKASQAASTMRVTASEIKELGIIDEVISEPRGGAHRNHRKTALILKTKLRQHIAQLRELRVEELLKLRYEKYRVMGVFSEPEKSTEEPTE